MPLRLLKHHLGRYPVPEWVDQQVYLHPYPKELMLRNHVQTHEGIFGGGPMIVQVDEQISLEVYFDPADREQGSDDEIRFRIHESGPKDMRLFEADETSFLLTIEQAEELAVALQKATAEARSLTRSVYPGVQDPDW